jgi:hypothetical protein
MNDELEKFKLDVKEYIDNYQTKEDENQRLEDEIKLSKDDNDDFKEEDPMILDVDNRNVCL